MQINFCYKLSYQKFKRQGYEWELGLGQLNLSRPWGGTPQILGWGVPLGPQKPDPVPDQENLKYDTLFLTQKQEKHNYHFLDKFCSISLLRTSAVVLWQNSVCFEIGPLKNLLF